MAKYHFVNSELNIKGKKFRCLVCEGHHGFTAPFVKDAKAIGYTVFDLRHNDNDMAHAATIETNVVVNYFGSMAVKDVDAVKLLTDHIGKKGYYRVTCISLPMWDDTSVEVKEELTKDYDADAAK